MIVLFKVYDKLVDLITLTVLHITCFLKVFKKNSFKYNAYIKQAMGQVTFSNYSVITCNFFVISIHCNVALTPTGYLQKF